MTGSIGKLLLINNRQAYSCTGGLIDALRPAEPVYLFCAERLERRATIPSEDWFVVDRDVILAHDGRSLWALLAGDGFLIRVMIE